MKGTKATIQSRKLALIKGVWEIDDVESIEFLEAFLRNKLKRVSKEDLLEVESTLKK